ncbi:MAG TPA: hypothetical protein VGN20_03480 [Mucilaginibacter sp.]|jgi:hypothetical protein
MPKYHQPIDLAKHVHNTLKDSKRLSDYSMPSQALLQELFEYLYYASMQSEEGELIKVTVNFYNPRIEIKETDDEETLDHWRYTPFKRPIKFNVKNLVKLSKAADPWSSSLAVYYDELDELLIYGLIDQAVHNQSFINHEIDSRPEQAGYFQAEIQGIGIISVRSEYRLIGVLRQNSLVTYFPDVWKFGQISELLKDKAASFINSVKNYLDKYFSDEEIESYKDLIHNIWRDTISRLLIQIKKYHHGGAILITDNVDNLDIKYPIVYTRLRSSMLRFVKTSIAVKLTEEEISRSGKAIDKSLYDKMKIYEYRKREANNELKGAIRFVASQSCVDGLILFNNSLHTLGFGAVIDEIIPPRRVYLSNTSKFKITTLTSKDPKEFGTRHRSMMTYCSQNQNAIGIVVSQDGDIRVMSQFEDKLIMWDNVKTQKYIR